MNEFITAGGPFMWPLLACSVLIITITIERSWFLQNRLVAPKGLKAQIINLLEKEAISKKQASEISNLSSLGFLLINCIKYKNLQRDNLESKIEEKPSNPILPKEIAHGNKNAISKSNIINKIATK